MLLLLLFACSGSDGGDTAAAACADDVGNICTFAGNGDAAWDGDGNDRLASSFYWPMKMEVSPYGDPVVMDWNNHRVRRLTADDTFETIIGDVFPGDGPADQSDLEAPGAPGTTVLLNHPTDAIYHPDGTLFLVAWHNHKLRTYDPATGNVIVHCGSGPGFVGDNYEPADGAKMAMPNSGVFDSAGNFYMVDQKNQRIRVLTPDFTIATIAGNGTKGFVDGTAAEANFSFPTGAQPEPGGAIALGPDGNLYVADTENHRVRKIDLASGAVTTIAGSGTAGFSGDGGAAVDAMLNNPKDLEFDADGLLWVADTDNHAVRTIDLASGIIDTAVGTGGQSGFAGDGAPATDALLYRPFGIDFDPDTGDLYVADTYNHRIRVVYR